MKLYVAGPMRGHPLFNFPAFDEAAGRLRSLGHEVRSPAENDREMGFDETHDSPVDPDVLAKMFRWDVEAVLWADALALLPGWRSSAGVAVEKAVADSCGTPCLVYDPTAIAASCLSALSQSAVLEAHEIVNGPRKNAYGHPTIQYGRVAKMWEVIFGFPITDPAKVGLAMVAYKITRELNRHDRDNVVDIAGYAETLILMEETP